MKIAIVGAGVSGLVAAHVLHARHDVTLFEANDYAGGHTHTVRVETDGGAWDVDTGFIVHNDRNYPEFQRLLARLGVATQPSEMSFGVSDPVGDFEYTGASPNGLYAKRSHLVTPWFQRMVADLVRFNREARTLLADGRDGHGPSLRAWLEARRYSRAFVERLIVPQAAAVWSADPRQLWSFPARFLVEFFDNHGMLGLRDRPRWRTIMGGSRRYVEAIAGPLGARLRLATPIRAIARHADHVELAPVRGEPERFDHVVIATHGDQALRMLADPSEREHELLGAFPYQSNDVTLHTDRGLLPRRRRAWASWNYHLLEREIGRPTVTYHMNRLQSLDADRELLVTLNRDADVRSEHVLGRFRYDHPVFTAAGVAAQRRRHELDAVARTSYCGAYWGWGFHEDGVVSALRACEALGGTL
ncbi:MAG TPA: FAD-dependent oxidoreductase [Conexibacter sp.]|jgi:predicted NAD/FAD-binding protein|nr:FAD-dependent oxidoreductase [Conexibacter sp.]